MFKTMSAYIYNIQRQLPAVEKLISGCKIYNAKMQVAHRGKIEQKMEEWLRGIIDRWFKDKDMTRELLMP